MFVVYDFEDKLQFAVCSVVEPHHVNADQIRGSASEKTDPDPLVNDFSEFCFPCSVSLVYISVF